MISEWSGSATAARRATCPAASAVPRIANSVDAQERVVGEVPTNRATQQDQVYGFAGGTRLSFNACWLIYGGSALM